MKIEIIQGTNITEVQNKVNKFCENVFVIDIKFNVETHVIVNTHYETLYIFVVMYADENDMNDEDDFYEAR